MNDLLEEEELNPDLAECIFKQRLGETLHHPLVVSYPYFPQMNRLLNTQLAQKRVAIAECIAKSDYHTVIFLHERAFRLDALNTHWNGMTLEHRHQIIRRVWLDCENVHENYDAWHDLWSEIDPLFAISPSDKQFFDKLPQRITVYRGASGDNADDGMSWTLDREKAIWFAKRFSNYGDRRPPHLATGLIDKSAIRSIIRARNESEVIVFPEDVEDPEVAPRVIRLPR